MKHLMEWLVYFLEKHSHIFVFNQIWLFVSSFCEMTAPNKTYSNVTQWQGKEMRTISQYLLAVLSALF